jgi:hypothetical protein
MKRRTIAILFVVAACSRDRDPSLVDDKMPRLDHAAFHPVLVKPALVSADTMFSIITLVRVANDTQLVAVNVRQPYLRLIDRRTGTLVAMLGKLGGGPGEFTTDPQIGPRPDGRTLWVFDMQKTTLTLTHLDPSQTPTDSVIHFATIGTNPSPIHIDDTTVLFVGTKDSTALATVNFRTAKRSLGGRQMSFSHDSLQMTPLWRNALSSDINGCRKPDGTRIVRFHREVGRVEYLSPAGDLVLAARVPYKFEQVLQPDGGANGRVNWARSWNQRVAYNACVATNDYVFALFSGRHARDFKPPSKYFPSEANVYEFVHVFDWDGNLVRVIQLEGGTWWSMDIDPKTMELFGIVDDPAPGVVKFDLKPVLPTKPAGH